MLRITSGEIIAVGTELLLGDIVNTDAAFVAQRLSELGITVYHQSVVGDNKHRLAEAIEAALSRSELLILTGGLGPTCDDITKEVAAECLSLPLVLHKASMEHIEAFFKQNDRKMTENNVKQAMLPCGATVFPNDNGLAPGAAIEDEANKRLVILLPGPPSELEPMFVNYVMPYLAAHTNSVLRSVNLHLHGIGESGAEAVLREIMDSSVNPTVAPYAGDGEVRIRITAKAASEAEAYAMCESKHEEIAQTEIGKYIYARSKTPSEAKNAAVRTLVRRLAESSSTLATAESCTGGMIAASVVDIAGASEIFLGSVVSYANSVKENTLHVKRDTLLNFGAVSEECAKEMCIGVKQALGSDYAVSVTGIAGPGGGSAKKPVGLVWFGVATPSGVYTKSRRFNSAYSRDRIRSLAAKEAVFMLLEHIGKENDEGNVIKQ